MTEAMQKMTKKEYRVDARATRRSFHQKNGNAFSKKIKEHFFASQHFMPQTVFAVYYPIGSEVNSRPLIDTLNDMGHITALPVIKDRQSALEFRVYRSEQKLNKGAFGVPEPSPNMPTVIPDFLIIPMLAFNKQGYRLGYGTGFYDRTLTEMRRAKPIKAIGVAYSVQQIDDMPVESHDEKMDWIITEKEALKIT